MYGKLQKLDAVNASYTIVNSLQDIKRGLPCGAMEMRTIEEDPS